MDNKGVQVYCNYVMNAHMRQLRKQAAKEDMSGGGFRRQAKTAYPWKGIAEFAELHILKEMNAQPNSPHVLRVGRIVQLFNQAREVQLSFRTFFESREVMGEFLNERSFFSHPGKPAPFYNTGYDFGTRFPELQKVNALLNRTLDELQKLTSRYRFTICVGPVQLGTESLRAEYFWRAGKVPDRWEHFAVSWLLRRDGEYIDRFRQCDLCRKWFFAIVEHQTFCSDNCRKKNAAQAESFKDKRKVYMREYRRREKDRERNSFTEARKAVTPTQGKKGKSR